MKKKINLWIIGISSTIMIILLIILLTNKNNFGKDIEYDELGFSTDYESAVLESATKIADNEYDLEIWRSPDTYVYIVNFIMKDVKDRKITFHLTNAGNRFYSDNPDVTEILYSCDGEDWNRIKEHTYVYPEYSFTETFPCNVVQIANIFPYTYTKAMKYIEGKSSSYAKTSVLGKSTDGRDIKMIEITNFGIDDDNKKQIYVIARQHAGETLSSYSVEGMIDFLTKNENREYRDKFHYYIVPIMNPDGVSDGWSRADTNYQDLNRAWGGNDNDEVNIVRDNIDAINGEYGIDFFMDWHTQADFTNTGHAVYIDAEGTRFREESLRLYDIFYKTGSFAGRNSVGVGTRTARGYTYSKNIFGMSFELTQHPPSITVESLKNIGKDVAESLSIYFNDKN